MKTNLYKVILKEPICIEIVEENYNDGKWEYNEQKIIDRAKIEMVKKVLSGKTIVEEIYIKGVNNE